MGLTYKQLREQIAARLTKLREEHTHDISPETLRELAKGRKPSVSPRAIRNWEDPEGKAPTLKALHAYLAYYDMSIGDFFRFDMSGERSQDIADFLLFTHSEAKAQAYRALFKVEKKQRSEKSRKSHK